MSLFEEHDHVPSIALKGLPTSMTDTRRMKLPLNVKSNVPELLVTPDTKRVTFNRTDGVVDDISGQVINTAETLLTR